MTPYLKINKEVLTRTHNSRHPKRFGSVAKKYMCIVKWTLCYIVTLWTLTEKQLSKWAGKRLHIVSVPLQELMWGTKHTEKERVRRAGPQNSSYTRFFKHKLCPVTTIYQVITAITSRCKCCETNHMFMHWAPQPCVCTPLCIIISYY